MSECGFDSRREFTSFEPFKCIDIHELVVIMLLGARSKSVTFFSVKILADGKREIPNPWRR